MENSKRRFLKGCGGLLAGISVYTVTKSPLASNGEPEPQVKYAMVHDESLCIGCLACEDACREVNQVPEGVTRLKILRTGPFGEYPDQRYHFRRHSCQHCESAPCVKVCPTGAAYIDKETGIVAVNEDRCVGCQYCIAACPYQVRFINPETKAADKCDFCQQTQLSQGLQPACVQACPTRALVFGNIKDPTSELVKLLKSKPSYREKVDLGTRPKLFHIQTIDGELVL
ncbi:4Fe-4S dicluster domain-containing protein [Shewanella eurypsychrophilus]|uniref:4Fe-4S dicluster domain-containing protein n=1 Tax=Shewanella eurypsychrophilus TaxID=2593656 RepID=A0ABX6VB91_9GAMM|nr:MULTISPECIES: 4Fe-4S dicluster domain-containing protein [Shewanella]QFU24760.1 4Fe-4S dicluster domain-containing protein [Shewanella sp. YLB-09]QPG59950.1 4Fe-4S dicluster domain-containing protein [Shewanella eurypsychrophilus]